MSKRINAIVTEQFFTYIKFLTYIKNVSLRKSTSPQRAYALQVYLQA